MTTTFSDLAPMTGRGLWWGLEVSFDNFATIAYRWATHAGDVGGYRYQARLVASSNILRGFGQDHLPAASTVSLVIDNTDFAADWMVNRATVASQVFKARFRLSVGLTSNSVNTYQAEVLTQLVGTFVCLNYPRRNDKAILISLADDSLGELADVLIAPSFNDWYADAGNTNDNCVFDLSTPSTKPLNMLIDGTLPFPLQFGHSPYEGLPACTFNTDRLPLDFDVATWGSGVAGLGTSRRTIYPIAVLATRYLGTIDTDTVTGLEGTLGGWGALKIPETFQYSGITYRIWKAYKTQTITKNGYDWKLLWIAFDAFKWRIYLEMLDNADLDRAMKSSGQKASKANQGDYFGGTFAAFSSFNITGTPGSGVYGSAGEVVNVMRDFVEYYSSLGAGRFDVTRFAKADLSLKTEIRGSIFAGGRSLAPTTGDQQLSSKKSPYGVGMLRKAIADLAGTADFDVFMTRDAKVAIISQGADFETGTSTYPAIGEVRINTVEDHTPSNGQRWTPYNRAFVQNGAETLGPYDNQDAIDEWGRVISKVLGSSWWWLMQNGKKFGESSEQLWAIRNLEAVVRPVITFTTDMSILTLELGDYFTMPWTRGGVNSAYASTLWRLESVTISPGQGSVQAAAVWMEDLRVDYPYLLDNETLVVRATPGGGQTLTVTDGSTTLVRSAGSFISDGLAPGDIIRIRDTSEAATTFFRNRDVKVALVTDATHVEMVGDTDFGTAGAHVVAAGEWQLYRGATTYPTAITDAANYPSGGLMYGKITDSAGEYSDASAGNKLLEG